MMILKNNKKTSKTSKASKNKQKIQKKKMQNTVRWLGICTSGGFEKAKSAECASGACDIDYAHLEAYITTLQEVMLRYLASFLALISILHNSIDETNRSPEAFLSVQVLQHSLGKAPTNDIQEAGRNSTSCESKESCRLSGARSHPRMSWLSSGQKHSLGAVSGRDAAEDAKHSLGAVSGRDAAENAKHSLGAVSGRDAAEEDDFECPECWKHWDREQ